MKGDCAHKSAVLVYFEADAWNHGISWTLKFNWNCQLSWPTDSHFVGPVQFTLL
jgi:hypothetical protein